MLKITAFIFILAATYYTFTYGKSLWVDDNNKLAAIGAMFVAVAGAIASITLILLRSP
jgi:hypothetical protein